jgi:Flp pilus assembly CpaF family ATPase
MAVNIRKFVLQAHSLDELVALGTITAHAARFLEAAVASGLNVLVSGGTQAGKTTLDIYLLWHTLSRDYCYHAGRPEGWCAGRFRGRG